MKTLLIVRHAKSDWGEPDRPDHDRPLKGRGKRAAQRMGRHLREQQLMPDLILCSTATRARKTAQLVAEACGYAGKIGEVEALYEGNADTYLATLRNAPAACERLMVVGHNPGLEELLETLTCKAERLPTAAVALVELPVNRWREVNADTAGALVQLWRPRELGD